MESYNYKCDIWSCGIIAYVLLCGTPPFEGKDDDDTFNKIKDGFFSFDDEVWDEISANCKDFIKKLLTYNPDKRPTAAEALKHPWLANINNNNKASKDVTVTAMKNMKNFRSETTMKQATVCYISSQLLAKEERDSLSKVFKALDKSGSGKIEEKEF